MPKITDYPEMTVPDDGDMLVIEDLGAANTKKVSRESLLAGAPLPPDTVDTQAIDDGAVTATKVGTGAILLDYAAVTSNKNSVTTQSDWSGLSLTVTVPAGGRSVKITAHCYGIDTNNADSEAVIYIYKDSNVIQQELVDLDRVDVTAGGVTLIAFDENPGAGSYTYKIAVARLAGTGTLSFKAASTAPAYILAELV